MLRGPVAGSARRIGGERKTPPGGEPGGAKVLAMASIQFRPSTGLDITGDKKVLFVKEFDLFFGQRRHLVIRKPQPFFDFISGFTESKLTKHFEMPATRLCTLFKVRFLPPRASYSYHPFAGFRLIRRGLGKFVLDRLWRLI
jgi:hypothetical protein